MQVKANTSSTVAHVLRLKPGADPKLSLIEYAKSQKLKSATVVSAVGSLQETTLRYANQKDSAKLSGFREVVSLTGTFSDEGAHLHLSVSDSNGVTIGGHLVEGSKVFTTLEIVILSFPELIFKRELDPQTTFTELVIQKK
ncbi:MAG: DNA-binding protein [Bacteriovoracaceae bacterium]|nr:DNA-binding protein [Bacteriovoracaceae bacterium]